MFNPPNLFGRGRNVNRYYNQNGGGQHSPDFTSEANAVMEEDSSCYCQSLRTEPEAEQGTYYPTGEYVETGLMGPRGDPGPMGSRGEAGPAGCPGERGGDRTARCHGTTGAARRYGTNGAKGRTGPEGTGRTSRLSAKQCICIIFRPGSDYAAKRRSSVKDGYTGYHPEHILCRSLFCYADPRLLCRVLLYLHGDEKSWLYKADTGI